MKGSSRRIAVVVERGRGFLSLLALAAGCGSSGGSPGADGPGSTGACAQTTSIARLPACASAPSTTLALTAGCTPSTDGTLHQEEWSDATCINVGAGGAGGDVIYAKYSGNDLYMAFSATPACGCGMAFSFDPNGHTAFDGDEFTVDLFDDPFMPDGDRGDFVVQGGNWVSGTAPAGIVSKCPGQSPNPINYELTIPFSALAITPGTAHTFRFAMNHPHTGTWPAGAMLPQTTTIPVDPSTWGEVSSAAAWR